MEHGLDDTSAAANRVQIGLLRAATPARRFALMRSLSATVLHLSRRAIAEADPSLSGREVLLRWAEVHYGRDLAGRVRRRLGERDR
jgi:hypothetical protein